MDVYSELKKAQAENLGSDPAAATKGRFYYKSTTEPLKVDDGTDIHKVITDRNLTASTAAIIANILNTLYPVGEVKEAMLTLAQFQAHYGANWILIDGQTLVAADYTVLAAARPDWVSGADLNIPAAWATVPFANQDDSNLGNGTTTILDIEVSGMSFSRLNINFFIKVL